MNTLIKQALSDSDIKNFFKGKINVMKHSDLNNVDNIDEVLEPYGRCVLLYEDGKLNTGHWTLVHRVEIPGKKPRLEVFDSYGIIPEGELKYIPKSFRRLSNQKTGTLLQLLNKQPLPVYYSQYRLQKLKNGVNTCGKWVLLRALYNDISENDFAKLMRSTEFSPDQLVCFLYEMLK